jgi:hypothetical protein
MNRNRIEGSTGRMGSLEKRRECKTGIKKAENGGPGWPKGSRVEPDGLCRVLSISMNYTGRDGVGPKVLHH